MVGGSVAPWTMYRILVPLGGCSDCAFWMHRFSSRVGILVLYALDAWAIAAQILFTPAPDFADILRNGL